VSIPAQMFAAGWFLGLVWGIALGLNLTIRGLKRSGQLRKDW